MNEWVKKSIQIANADGYLDGLQSVYPVVLTEEREIPKDTLDDLKKAFNASDSENLIKKLLSFEKFPIKDPYVAFLRRKKGIFIKKNPKTITRIAGQLYSMGFDKVIEGITEPKEFNRQIGSLFSKWIPKMGFPILDESKFESHKGVCFLAGGDSALKNYAENKLKYDIEKGIDIIAKAGNAFFFLGEAKFLTDYGGHQIAQFEDALRTASFKKGNCIGMAILDGVVWIESKNKMHRKVCKTDHIILSALLLKDFLLEVNSKGLSSTK